MSLLATSAGLRQFRSCWTVWRLEYRGYDSAGLATINGGGIEVRKTVGRIADLTQVISASPPHGHLGISHTRWATHGGVTNENAHPHFDASRRLVLVHNGVIENYLSLRAQLEEKGHVFNLKRTPSSCPPHRVGLRQPQGQSALVEAVRESLRQVIGTYGIAVIHADVPGVLIGARRGSPLVLGRQG